MSASVDSLRTSIQHYTADLSQKSSNITGLASGANSIKTTYTMSEGAPSIKFERASSPETLNLLLQTQSSHGKAGVISDYHSKIASQFGNVNSSKYLGSVFSEMIGSLNVLQPDAPGSRSEAVAKAQDFCSAVSSYTQGLESVRREVEEDLSSAFEKIGDILQELSGINKRLKGATTDFPALDRRDALLRELSPLMSFTTSFSENGAVSINSQFSERKGLPLLNDSYYTRFYYSQSLSADSPSMDVSLSKIKANGDSGATTNLSLSVVSMGGEIEGLLNVRDKVLPSALADINTKTTETKRQIDKLHNLGSGHPPRSVLTSARSDINPTDTAIYSGTSFIQAVKQEDGQPVLGQRPIRLDFDRMLKLSPYTSVSEIVAEINAEASCDSNVGVAIGPNVYGQENINLINQASLVTTNIDAIGRFSCQLRLASGAHNVDSTLEITQAIVVNGAGGPGVRPGLVDISNASAPFLLPAGQTLKTGQNINITLPNNGQDPQATVYLQVLVTGTDGTFQRTWLRYDLGEAAGAPLANQHFWNSRIQGTAAPVVPTAGVPLAVTNPAAANTIAITQAVTPPVALMAGVQARASLENGRMVLSSIRDNTGIMIIDSGASIAAIGASDNTITENFSEHFGLNNFFTAGDKDNPAATLAVNSDIIADPSRLAIGIPTMKTISQTVQKGELFAQATLSFAGGINAANGDTITINGKRYTFGIGNEMIPPGANGPETVRNIVRFLNSSTLPQIKELVTFSVDTTGNILIATAKNPGTKGNNITVGAMIAAAAGDDGVWIATPAIFAGAPAPAPAPTAHLDGGKNIRNTTDTEDLPGALGDILTYSYEIGVQTIGAFTQLTSPVQLHNRDGSIVTMSLESYLNQLLSKISTDAKMSKEDAVVEQKAIDNLAAQLKSETIHDKNQTLLEAVELNNLMKLIFHVRQIIERSKMFVIEGA